MFNSLAPWLSEPTTYLPTTVKAQPPGASPLQPTDLLLGWQDGQHPSTRAIEIQELFTSTSLSYPFLPLTGGTVNGNLTVSGVMMLSRDPSQALEAATKQYVDGHSGGGPITGGPFLPTTGGVLNGPGNLVVAGTLGVNGAVTISSAGINYAGIGSTNVIAFNWNGAVISGYVDTTYIGDFATVSSVSGNYLPLAGGTITGNFGVNGNTTLRNTTFAGNLGIAFTGVYNSGVSYAFGWDGTAINYAINGAGKGQLYTVGQNDGRYKAIGSYTPNQVVDYLANPSFFHLYVRGNLGIQYTNFTDHWIAFGWNGSFPTLYVDGTYQYQIASTDWVGVNFAPYSWVNANFKPIGAYTPNQVVDWDASPTFWNLTVHGDIGIRYVNSWMRFGWNGRVQCWIDGGGAYVELRDTRDYTPNQSVDNGSGPRFDHIMLSGQTIYFADNLAYYWNRTTDGWHQWVENGTPLLQANGSAGCYIRHSVHSKGTVYFSTDQIGDTYSMWGDGNGRAIQFTADGWKLAWSTNGNFHFYNNSGQPMFSSEGGNFGAWGNFAPFYTSDERVKRDIEPYTRGLAEICKLKPITFVYNGLGTTEHDNGRTRTGLSAQATREIMPEIVMETEEPSHDPTIPRGPDWRIPGQLSMDREPLLFAAINAIRELAEMNTALAGRVEQLELRK
jgi:hypothetical protein